MTEKEFWALIQEANAQAENTKAIPHWLANRLAPLDTREIVDFSAWEAHFLDQANDERLWAAACQVACGLSDDSFVYFRCWLVAQGEAICKAAIAEPDSLADIEYKEHDFFGPSILLEEMLYVSARANGQKLGVPEWSKMEIPADYRPPADCSPDRTPCKNPGFLRLMDDVEVLKANFPKLMKRFSPERKRIAREKYLQELRANGVQLRGDK